MGIDPRNMMPPPNQRPSPDQPFPLPTERQKSTIPKAGTTETWTYPSQQMCWNALAVKPLITLHVQGFVLLWVTNFLLIVTIGLLIVAAKKSDMSSTTMMWEKLIFVTIRSPFWMYVQHWILLKLFGIA